MGLESKDAKFTLVPHNILHQRFFVFCWHGMKICALWELDASCVNMDFLWKSKELAL